MNIFDFFKKHKMYNIKDIKELPKEYKDIIYEMRPDHTLLGEDAFVNLYTSVLIDNDLYLLDVTKAENYLNSKHDAYTSGMIEFIYSTETGDIIKNRFGKENRIKLEIDKQKNNENNLHGL